MVSFTRNYLLLALAGTPELIERLLKDASPGSDLWDKKPDPERFTVREVLAHLAEWDIIFTKRIVKVRDEDEPAIPDLDEGELAIKHNYAHSDPYKSLASLSKSRAELLKVLKGLPETAWARIGYRMVGPMSIEEQASLIAFHDSYHVQQIMEWLHSA